MIDRLAGENGYKDLLALAEMLGGLAFTTESEKVWFKRRFAMFQDIMKDSWVYQEIVQESEERGMQKGWEKGLEKALQDQRQVIVQTMQERFPALEAMAKQKVASIADMRALNLLLVNIASTREIEIVRALLTAPGSN